MRGQADFPVKSGDPKHDHIAHIVPQRPGHLFEIAERALRLLRATPAKIRSFFADPKLAYIHRVYA